MERKSNLRKYDALDLLMRDHEVIKQLFWDYRRLVKPQGDPERKAEVISQLCLCLSMHAQIEEEIFYPAVRVALRQNELESNVACDHIGQKLLIARLDEMEPDDPDYDATVADLSADIVPHIDDEEQNVFQKLRRSDLNMAELGHRMAQRRRALQADVTRVGLPPSTIAVAAATGAWPVACHVAFQVSNASDAPALFSWSER